MTDSRNITGIFIFVGVLIFGLWLGISIVTDQIETLMYVAAGTTLITCAALGRRVWLILPFAMTLNLSLQIPGQPTTQLLAYALFCSFCVLLFLMRRLPLTFKFSELDFWILLLTACVVQTYLRNPVGLNILGGDSVGARPYVIFVATLLTCIILGHLKVSITDLKWILRLHIIGGLLNFAILTVGYFIPRVGVWVGAVGVESLATEIRQKGQYGIEGANRIGFLGQASNNLSLWISSFKSPIKACFHPIWAPLVLLSFAFAALSGFRNEIGALGLTYLIGIAYRGGLPSVLIATFTLILGLTFLAFINLNTPLPANMQRSLSFLPGTWNQAYISDAEESTNWRIQMWEEALLTDFWIQSKILGDGLGLSRQELNFIQSLEGQNINTVTIRGGLSLQQQSMMATGAYHSGPVSTVRAVGYLGLIILLSAQIRLAVRAHRQIKRTKNTEWLPLALLIGIPLIFAPFFFVVIYGDFGVALASFLIGAAMVRLLENNLPLPAYVKRSRHSSPSPNSTRFE